ncbi:MAG: LysR family transcriptional regulator [Betaproteobacteria bacterium]|jgi:DNA-binding transcriptional LysR family regulator|nr:LysR family transcriptional regulator [Betaproteobacteria bacterium]
MAMNLRSVDLNLLTVFDAVYAEGNLSRAARRLAMTQPAVSNALARFRALTRDRLFVRTARGVTPTPLAHRLAEPVRRALELVREGLEGVRAFDPRTSRRRFTLASAFGIEALVGADILNWARRVAPGVMLRGVAVLERERLWPDLRDGIIDLAADFIPPRDDRFASERVMQAEAVAIARKGHPRIGSRLTLSRYLDEEHVVLTRGNPADARLEGAEALLALDRKVLLEVPSSLAIALVVSQSDLVGVLGRRLAEMLAPQLGLKILPMPIKLPLFPAYLVWHHSRDADPGHQWLRQGIKDVFAKL